MYVKVIHGTVHVCNTLNCTRQYKHNMLNMCTHKAMRQRGVMYLVCCVVVVLHQVYKKGENLSGTLTMAVPYTGCTLWQGLQEKKKKSTAEFNSSGCKNQVYNGMIITTVQITLTTITCCKKYVAGSEKSFCRTRLR